MAGYKGHTIGGLCAGTIVLFGYYVLSGNDIPDQTVLESDWQLSLGLLVISVLFALWPDVDTNSKAQDLFFGVAFVFDALLIVFGYYEAAALLGFLAMTPIVGNHRGWTHSRWSMVLLPSPIVILPYLGGASITTVGWLIYFAAVAGYFSHLLLDGRIVKFIRIKSAWR